MLLDENNLLVPIEGNLSERKPKAVAQPIFLFSNSLQKRAFDTVLK